MGRFLLNSEDRGLKDRGLYSLIKTKTAAFNLFIYTSDHILLRYFGGFLY